MKRINFKKFLPGLVSIIIIAGMAAQSFATNIDLAAFVSKDKYMTKYYELDFKIDDIEKSLNRLYKFTCTNVRSYGGAGLELGYALAPWAQMYSGNNTYHWYQNPMADLVEQKYLKVAQQGVINAISGSGNVHTATKEIPASLLKWNKGVQLYPNTKITCKFTRTWGNGGGPSHSYELIMGPFKKFPHITGTNWNTGTICQGSQAYFPGFYQNTSATTTYYAYGSDTVPTNWTNIGNGVLAYQRTVTKNNPNSQQIDPEAISLTDVVDNMYHNRVKGEVYDCALYFYSTPTTNISSYDKVWIRSYVNNTTQYLSHSHYVNIGTINLDTWNNNK